MRGKDGLVAGHLRLRNRKKRKPVPEATEHKGRARGDPLTTDVTFVYTDDELDFLRAIDRYKTDSRRPHPHWSEVLAVLVSRGWRRVAEPGPLPRFQRHKNGYTA